MNGAFREEAIACDPKLAEAAPELLTVYRDGMTALLEGMCNTPILTPDGVHQGLEQVRRLDKGRLVMACRFDPHGRFAD